MIRGIIITWMQYSSYSLNNLRDKQGVIPVLEQIHLVLRAGISQSAGGFPFREALILHNLFFSGGTFPIHLPCPDTCCIVRPGFRPSESHKHCVGFEPFTLFAFEWMPIAS